MVPFGVVPIGRLARRNPLLLVLDEFQDVAQVPQAEAALRGSLQTLPHQAAVVIMGSKRHLLSNMFSRPKAPFHNWGDDLEIEPIPYEEYTAYMNERFARFGLSIENQVSQLLQDKLLRNPEAINMVCRSLIEILCGNSSTIQAKDLAPALARTVERRAKRFEGYIATLSPSEQRVLREISRKSGTTTLQGKEFVARTKLSATAVRKAQKNLEENAVILKIDGKYHLADPLLSAYLLLTR